MLLGKVEIYNSVLFNVRRIHLKKGDKEDKELILPF
jgi:hypothetical protein